MKWNQEEVWHGKKNRTNLKEEKEQGNREGKVKEEEKEEQKNRRGIKMRRKSGESSYDEIGGEECGEGRVETQQL